MLLQHILPTCSSRKTQLLIKCCRVIKKKSFAAWSIWQYTGSILCSNRIVQFLMREFWRWLLTFRSGTVQPADSDVSRWQPIICNVLNALRWCAWSWVRAPVGSLSECSILISLKSVSWQKVPSNMYRQNALSPVIPKWVALKIPDKDKTVSKHAHTHSG